MKTPIDRRLARIAYYARNVPRDLLPAGLFRRRLQGLLERARRLDPASVSDRLGYYNQLLPGATAGPESHAVARIPRLHSMYYYDLRSLVRYFPADLRVSAVQGDTTVVPEHPAFVKSRPVRGENRNAVLLPLNRFRHFYFPSDCTPFEAKRSMAIWRGAAHTPLRRTLLARASDPKLVDLGNTRVDDGRAYLSPAEQLRYRYVLSVEGRDVATNLKWILASNSLCLMPKPTAETWFMEGILEAGVHYVELRDDFEDLEEKIVECEREPERVRAIVRRANEHARRFFDASIERLLSLLVVHRYFVTTGQLDEDARLAAFWRSP